MRLGPLCEWLFHHSRRHPGRSAHAVTVVHDWPQGRREVLVGWWPWSWTALVHAWWLSDVSPPTTHGVPCSVDVTKYVSGPREVG